MISLVVLFPDGRMIKQALLNNTLRYETNTLDTEINLTKFNSESEMCQEFFRRVNDLAKQV